MAELGTQVFPVPKLDASATSSHTAPHMTWPKPSSKAGTGVQTCFFFSLPDHKPQGPLASALPVPSPPTSGPAVSPLSSQLFWAQPPTLSAGPTPLPHPPNLITQGLTSCYVASPFPFPGSPLVVLPLLCSSAAVRGARRVTE